MLWKKLEETNNIICYLAPLEPPSPEKYYEILEKYHQKIHLFTFIKKMS
jgi:hypothetical protein